MAIIENTEKVEKRDCSVSDWTTMKSARYMAIMRIHNRPKGAIGYGPAWKEPPDRFGGYHGESGWSLSYGANSIWKW